MVLGCRVSMTTMFNNYGPVYYISVKIDGESERGLVLFNMCSKTVFDRVLVISPRYVVTFSQLMDTKEDPQAIIIWDILTGQKKRGFHCESSAHWPIFKSVLHLCWVLLSSCCLYRS